MQRIIYGLLGLILVLGLTASPEPQDAAPLPDAAVTIDIDAPSPLEQLEAQNPSHGLIAKVLSQKTSPLANTHAVAGYRIPLSFLLHTLEAEGHIYATFKTYILFRAILI